MIASTLKILNLTKILFFSSFFIIIATGCSANYIFREIKDPFYSDLSIEKQNKGEVYIEFDKSKCQRCSDYVEVSFWGKTISLTQDDQNYTFEDIMQGDYRIKVHFIPFISSINTTPFQNTNSFQTNNRQQRQMPIPEKQEKTIRVKKGKLAKVIIVSKT